MNRHPSRSRTPLVLALVIALGLPASATLAAVPDRIDTQDGFGVVPLWLSEAAFLGDRREPQWDLLPPSAVTYLKNRLAFIADLRNEDALTNDPVDPGQCRTHAGAPHTGQELPSMAALVGVAEYLMAGTVTDVKDGLWHGRIGTLYEVALDTFMSGAGGAGPQTILLFLPIGSIEVGGELLCTTDLHRSGALAVDDRVLTVVNAYAYRAAEGVVFPSPAQLFWQAPFGPLHAPAGFNSIDYTTTLDALIASAISQFEAKAGGKR